MSRCLAACCMRWCCTMAGWKARWPIGWRRNWPRRDVGADPARDGRRGLCHGARAGRGGAGRYRGGLRPRSRLPPVSPAASVTSRGSRRSRPIGSVIGCGRRGRKDIAYFIQMRVSEVFGIDIHPAARIGKGIMIDHAHSIVIGETAVVGDNVSMLHSVTLGGTGKETEDRHPKIGDGVLIGAGAKVLGNIRSAIAAGSPPVRWCWRKCRPARRWRAFRHGSWARRVRPAVDEHGSSVRRQRLGS
jgi:hypothetical protein